MMLLMIPRLSSEGKAAKHLAYFKDLDYLWNMKVSLLNNSNLARLKLMKFKNKKLRWLKLEVSCVHFLMQTFFVLFYFLLLQRI